MQQLDHSIEQSYARYFKSRNIRLINKVEISQETTCYVFDAAVNIGEPGPSGRVGSVLFVTGPNISMAFTRGSPFFEDNFDRDDEYQKVQVENCIFGALKLCIEMHSVDKLSYSKENHNLLLKNIFNIHSFIFSRMQDPEKKYPDQDPLVQLCLKDFKNTNEEHLKKMNFRTLKRTYLELRQGILDKIPHTMPKIAKVAVGQRVVFPLIEEMFEIQQLGMWGVYFTRLFFMHLNESKENGVFPLLYTMFHKFGVQQEWSRDDDNWANKNNLVPTEDSGPLCYFKPEYNSDPFAHYVREMIFHKTVNPPKKKLGRVNDWVALKLQIEAETPLEDSNFLYREALAKNMLRECGWSDWFDSKFSENGLSVSDSGFKNESLKEMIRNIEPSHVLTLLETISIH